MENNILISCAAGNVGSEIAKQLKENNIPCKAADVLDVKEILGSEFENIYLNFENMNSCKEAFTGIKKLFLNRPPHMVEFDNTIFPALDIAKEKGVEHIVFLSMIGVNKRVPHYKIENYLKNLGINYTILRASFFMQNLNTIHGEVIKKERDLLIPAGKGKISFIDIRDIAAVAVKVLSEPGDKFVNATLNLTGSEALNFNEVSEIMTKVLGEEIKYSNPKGKVFAKVMTSYGFPKEIIKVMKMIYLIVKLGKAGDLHDDTEKLLGRKPIKMEQYVQDHIACWR